MADWLTNLTRFQVARPDHVQVESCPRALESFVRPRALDSFDQWHVTRSPPIRKRIWVGRYNKYIWSLFTVLMGTGKSKQASSSISCECLPSLVTRHLPRPEVSPVYQSLLVARNLYSNILCLCVFLERTDETNVIATISISQLQSKLCSKDCKQRGVRTSPIIEVSAREGSTLAFYIKLSVEALNVK